MPRPFTSFRSLASSRATTFVLLGAAIALWSFILTAPSRAETHSNDLDVRAAPTVGDHHAPVQLIYFYRPDCVYCAEVTPAIQRLVSENGDVVYARLVQVTTDRTVDGPVADICAERSAGRPVYEHSYCLADASLRADVEADLALADRLGVDGVPTILLGRSRIVGVVSYSTLDSLLQVSVADR